MSRFQSALGGVGAAQGFEDQTSRLFRFDCNKLFCRCLHDCFVDMGDYGMEESVRLSVTQQFDVERMNRAIESILDPQQLQVLAKQLLQAWHSQRAATAWVTRQRDQLS